MTNVDCGICGQRLLYGDCTYGVCHRCCKTVISKAIKAAKQSRRLRGQLCEPYSFEADTVDPS